MMRNSLKIPGTRQRCWSPPWIICSLCHYQDFLEIPSRGPQWPSGWQVWHLITGCHLCVGFDSHKWQHQYQQNLFITSEELFCKQTPQQKHNLLCGGTEHAKRPTWSLVHTQSVIQLIIGNLASTNAAEETLAYDAKHLLFARCLCCYSNMW